MSPVASVYPLNPVGPVFYDALCRSFPWWPLCPPVPLVAPMAPVFVVSPVVPVSSVSLVAPGVPVPPERGTLAKPAKRDISFPNDHQTTRNQKGALRNSVLIVARP